jgi:hypothetical protein
LSVSIYFKNMTRRDKIRWRLNSLLGLQGNFLGDPLVFYVFLAFTPALLAIKFITRKPAWWLVVLLIVLLGWSIVIGGYIAEQSHISELIKQGRHDELPKGWDSDGASGLFSFLGGWLFALAYLIPWLAIYALAALIRKSFRSKAEKES